MKRLTENASGFFKDLRELLERWRLDDIDGRIRRVRKAIKEERPDQAMREIDKIIEGHGVEYIGGVDMHDGPPYEYVNTGETYEPTVMWSRDENKFFVAAWGDMIEEVESSSFDDGWDSWLRKDFERGIEREINASEELGEPKQIQLVETLEELDDDALKEMFHRAKDDWNNSPDGQRAYVEISTESDGSLFVHNLPRVIKQAGQNFIQKGGLVRNGGTSTRKPLEFKTKSAASAWLTDTNNFGFVHESMGVFIVCQTTEGAVWAFSAPDEMVHLPHW